MTLKKIETYTRYLEIVERYGQKGCASNDFIQREAADLVVHDLLYESCGEKNAFVLVKKEGFYRVYYYINDYSELLVVPEETLETEILFRGMIGEPTEVVEYLERCGFKRLFVRDQYAAMYKDLQPSTPNEEIIVQPALTLVGVKSAFDLFNQSFDKYSGDYVSPEHYEALLASGNVLMAWRKEENETMFLGALHQSMENNVAWISHVAVKESVRGRHVGRALMDTFVERNMNSEKSRYMLWVQKQNKPAVAMYEKKGFSYSGKSSLSMIKKTTLYSMEKLMELLKGIRPDVDFENEAALIDDGILDSFDVVSIISEIDDLFGVQIRINVLDPESFNSAENIWNMIQELKAKP